MAGARLLVPLPPRCPATRRRSPGTPIHPIALILYHLSPGQARCASAHVTLAAPAAGSAPWRAWPPGGSTWPTPEGGPAALPPRRGVQRCSRGLQAVPANTSGTAHVCTLARGGASPKPPGAPRPHRTRTEAAPCVARTAASAEQRLKGRATRLGALCHCSRLAIFAGLLKPCRPDCPASSAAPATGRSGARLGACPGVPPTVGCATRARAPRRIGAEMAPNLVKTRGGPPCACIRAPRQCRRGRPPGEQASTRLIARRS